MVLMETLLYSFSTPMETEDTVCILRPCFMSNKTQFSDMIGKPGNIPTAESEARRKSRLIRTQRIKQKNQTSRLKDDYEFLKSLETKLEPAASEDHNDEEEVEEEEFDTTGEVLRMMVKDGINYLDDRAEFWINMK